MRWLKIRFSSFRLFSFAFVPLFIRQPEEGVEDRDSDNRTAFPSGYGYIVQIGPAERCLGLGRVDEADRNADDSLDRKSVV